jgi:NodT family efflux transporter outer membrane factor (OMF) lipoprotein
MRSSAAVYSRNPAGCHQHSSTNRSELDMLKLKLCNGAGLTMILVVLSGCAVGPNYKRPTVQIPAAYKEDVSDAYNGTDGWKRAQPGDELVRGRWWEVFNDAQLNALEERVNISNQNIKTAEAQFRQARALVQANRSGYLPTITTAPSVTSVHPSTGQAIRPFAQTGTYTSFVVPVDFSYETDLWGRVRRTVEGSQATAQASAADLETIRLSMNAELSADYFQLRAVDRDKQLLDSTVTAYEKALELTTNRYKGGVASQADVAQAETQLETARAQAIDVGVLRAQLEHAIAALIGETASTFSIQPESLSLSPPNIPVALPSGLLERRPDIAGAERRVAAANAQIGLARSAYFPALNFSASAGFESTSIGSWLSWPSRLWSLGPTLAQTLFDGGRRRAGTEQAKAGYDATVAAYRQVVLTAFQEVEDNLAALRILADEAQQQETAVKAANRSLGVSMTRYKGGITTYLEVINAQAAVLANERTLVDLWQRRMVASVALIKALGGGWDGYLPTVQDLKASTNLPASREPLVR